MAVKKLPIFVKCIDNSENKVCEPGRVYSTIEPVTQVKAAAFWKTTLHLFPNEFEVADLQAYLNQKDEHDHSFNCIVPPHPDSAFFKAPEPKPKKKRKLTYKNFIATPPEETIPRYVKYVGWCVYADFWLGLKHSDIGKTFCTDVEFNLKTKSPSQKWRTALRLFKECFEISDKLQWNLSREHSVTIIKESESLSLS